MPEDLLVDDAGGVASRHPARMAQGCLTVMRVVALHNHEEGAIMAFARRVEGAGSRMLEECLHLVALDDGTPILLARRSMHEKSGTGFQFHNGGLPGGGGGAVLVHTLSVRKKVISTKDTLQAMCLSPIWRPGG